MLRFPRAIWLATLLAFVLALPSLFADFYCDDEVMVLRLEGVIPAPIPGPFHLYTFAAGDPLHDEAVRLDRGAFPWWTSSGLKISFFRPLASALFAFDHAIAGRHPLFYHLHTIAWYAAAVACAALLFRRLLPEREAALSALLFAMAPAHWTTAAWPSARHVAISATFVLLALLAYLSPTEPAPGSGRARRWTVPFVALLLTAVALAAGESATGVFGYVFAYELLGRESGAQERATRLAPWAIVLATYAAIYKGFGFGVRESGMYIDPISQPLDFALAIPGRLLVFANAAITLVPSEITAIFPSATPLLASIGALFTVGFLLLLRRAWAPLSPKDQRTLTWLLVGAGLALLPGAAGIPGDRVLFLPDLGIMAAFAVVLLRARAAADGGGRGRLVVKSAVGLFAAFHIVLAPLDFAFGTGTFATSSRAARAAVAKGEFPAQKGATIVGVGLSDPLIGMYLGPAVLLSDPPLPAPLSISAITTSLHDHIVKRLDDRTLEISIEGGTLLEAGFETVVRGGHERMAPGDTFAMGQAKVLIKRTLDGRPTLFSVTFDRSLDDPDLALIIWKNKGIRRLSPPKVGEEIRVMHEAGPMGI